MAKSIVLNKKNMQNIRNMKKKVFGFLVVLVILSPFFFFILQNLGYKSLESFDEALYATLARNILKSGNFLELRYNGEPFADHPPGSVWFMSLAFGIFGVNEFSARIYSALSSAPFIRHWSQIIFQKSRLERSTYVGVITLVYNESQIW